MHAMRSGRISVVSLAAAFIVGLWMTGTANALPVGDTYTRADNTAVGTTEVGGVSYEEFNSCCGLLFPDPSGSVAQIESNRLRITGGTTLPTDPGAVRLRDLGFDLDVTAVVSVLGDNYDPLTAANGPALSFRHGMDNPDDTTGTKGAVHLAIFPDGRYTVSAITSSAVGGFPTLTVPATAVVLVNAQPIGPAFAAADADGDGILESNEPFTVTSRIVDNTFCWFINGIQVGPNLTIPDGAITGVDQTVATNFLMGRTRLIHGGIELDVAYDNLSIDAAQGACPTPSVAVAIDIKPGSDPNSINPRSKGVIPVAILTTDSFDASTVDPSTVAFGPNGATEAHGQGHLEDVDGDGDLDLVLHFRTQETGIQCGDTEAILTGQTFGGQAIEGSDAVNTVGCS